MTTRNALQIPQEWTSLESLTGIPAGTEILLQNVGIPADIIEVALADAQPSESFRGVNLDQLKSFYQISAGQQAIWVRFRRLDDGEIYDRKGLLQVIDPKTITPYSAGIPSEALQSSGLGSEVINVATESAGGFAAVRGNVYGLSGIVSIAGGAGVGINFNLTESIIIRRVKADGDGTQDVELLLYSQDTIGTANGSLTPYNVNGCSPNTTTVTADVVTAPITPAGNLLEFGVNEIVDGAGLGCEDANLSVVINRRDNGGAENIRFLILFEIAPQKFGEAAPQIILQADTQLEANTEMSIYG